MLPAAAAGMVQREVVGDEEQPALGESGCVAQQWDVAEGEDLFERMLEELEMASVVEVTNVNAPLLVFFLPSAHSACIAVAPVPGGYFSGSSVQGTAPSCGSRPSWHFLFEKHACSASRLIARSSS
jgi:hypothetical protein